MTARIQGREGAPTVGEEEAQGSRAVNSCSPLSHTAPRRASEAADAHTTVVCWRMALRRLSGDYCCGE